MAVHKKYASSALGRGLDDLGAGRGLDALIDTGSVMTGGGSNLLEVPLVAIDPNPNQPRGEFNKEALQELANSIKEIGIVQPVTLRQMGDGRYQIIAGERRWRASQIAGLETIPAYIRTARDENVMEMALVENIQREDLNAIEIALAYQHLAEQTGMTQEKISERVGKSRAAVTNYMRLLKLPAEVQMALKNKTLDMGHARALLAIESPSLQLKLFREVAKHGYSVRQVEEMAQRLKGGEDVQTATKKMTAQQHIPEQYGQWRDSLSKALGQKVKLTCSDGGKGKLSIPFASAEELRLIMEKLNIQTTDN